MTRIKICKDPDCHNAATTAGFCRLHYLKNWKQLKDEQRRKSAKKLNSYIESVLRSHPDNYMDVIKKDIRSPHFDKYVSETFGYDEDSGNLFDEPAYEEEVERLIKELKLDKEFR